MSRCQCSEALAYLSFLSRSFAVAHNEHNSTKRTFMERGRISLHSGSCQANSYTPVHIYDSSRQSRPQKIPPRLRCVNIYIYTLLWTGRRFRKYQVAHTVFGRHQSSTRYADLERELHPVSVTHCSLRNRFDLTSIKQWCRISSTDLRPDFANSYMCFEIVMSTKNRFHVPKKTVVGRSEVLPLESLLGYSDECRWYS